MAYYQEKDLNEWEWIEKFGNQAAKLITQVITNKEAKPRLTADYLNKAAASGSIPTEEEAKAAIGKRWFDPGFYRDWVEKNREKAPPQKNAPNSATDLFPKDVPMSTSGPMDEAGMLPRSAADAVISSQVAPTPPAPTTAATAPATTPIVVRELRPLTNIGRAYGAAARDSNLTQLVNKTALETGVEHDALLAMIEQESDFNPRAVGAKGELGLFQIMPQNLERMGVNVKDPAIVEQYKNDVGWQFRTAAEWIRLNKPQFPNINEPQVLAAVWNGGQLPQNIKDPEMAARVADYQSGLIARMRALQYLRTGQPVLRPNGKKVVPVNPNNLAGEWREVS